MRPYAATNKGRLWLGTIDGITILDLATKTTSRFLPAKKNVMGNSFLKLFYACLTIMQTGCG
jgi:ligand-binding sensor domain-containing protein